MPTSSNSQKGQSLVIIALLLVGMLGFLGLVLDGGGAYFTKRNGQDAADAAAFAGVRVLALRGSNNTPSKETEIYTTTVGFATANRVITSTDVIVAYIAADFNQTKVPIRTINPASPSNVPSNATGILVTTTLNLQPYFIDLLIGNQAIPIPSVAAAQSGSPTVGGGTEPVIIPITTTQTLTINQPIQIWGDSQAPGSWQWISFGCVTNPQDISKYLDPWLGNVPPLVVADPTNQSTDPTMAPTASWLCTDPGQNAASFVKTAMDHWLVKPEAQRHWLVPIYNYQNTNAQGQSVKYHVVGFAEFVLLSYILGTSNYAQDSLTAAIPCQGQSHCIWGKFIQFVAADNIQFKPGPCNTNGVDVCGVGLSQ